MEGNIHGEANRRRKKKGNECAKSTVQRLLARLMLQPDGGRDL